MKITSPYIFILIAVIIVLGVLYFIKIRPNEDVVTGQGFSYKYPYNYTERKGIDGSIVIESPIDNSVIVMDASYRKEMITITTDKKDWGLLHFSDTRYTESIEFTRNYFEKLGWDVIELRVDGLPSFKLDRDGFVNTYIIFKDNAGRYFLIDTLTMGDKTDTPGLDMVLKTFKFNSK